MQAEKAKHAATSAKKFAKCTGLQAKVALAEARIKVLQEQLNARPSAPAPQADLNPFFTKALESVKPDYSGIASLLTAARQPSQEATHGGLASRAAQPTYSYAQLMEMKTLFTPP